MLLRLTPLIQFLCFFFLSYIVLSLSLPWPESDLQMSKPRNDQDLNSFISNKQMSDLLQSLEKADNNEILKKYKNTYNLPK